MDPPIQVVYFRSGGAKILILVPLTASLSNSFFTRCPNPTHQTPTLEKGWTFGESRSSR